MTATNIFYNFVGFRYSPALTKVVCIVLHYTSQYMPTSGSGTGLITLEPGCQPVVVVQA